MTVILIMTKAFITPDGSLRLYHTWGGKMLKSGVVPVLLNTLLSSEVVNDIINNSRAKAVFISSGLLSSFENSVKKNVNIKHIIEVGTKKSNYINFEEEIQKCSFKETIKCSKDEIAFWLYSSGSTGQQKVSNMFMEVLSILIRHMANKF